MGYHQKPFFFFIVRCPRIHQKPFGNERVGEKNEKKGFASITAPILLHLGI